MNPVDPNWIESQHRCFLNWANSQLSNKNVQLTNLTEDLKNGVHLLELLSELLHTSIPIPTINPQFRIQMMNNLTEALEIIKKECDISLLNIDSNDIVDGNIKLVLALIHSLMYKYQVCKAMSSDRCVIDKNTPMTVVERQLIDWLNSIIYNSQPVITNISNDWMNGEHLKNLLHHFLPNQFNELFESMNSMNPSEKLSECIRLAEKELKIPKILEAQDIANGPDSFSMLAYLSYFRMVEKKELSKSQPEMENQLIPSIPEPPIIEKQIEIAPPIVSNIPPVESLVKIPHDDHQSTLVSTMSNNNNNDLDDNSSAPPLSPPPPPPPSSAVVVEHFQNDHQMITQRPVTVSNNNNMNDSQGQGNNQMQYYPQHQEQPRMMQQRSTSLTTSTYLPDQSNQVQGNSHHSHISSMYSPRSVQQLIPGVPTQSNSSNIGFINHQLNQNNQLMVHPPLPPQNQHMLTQQEHYHQSQPQPQPQHYQSQEQALMMMNPYQQQFGMPNTTMQQQIVHQQPPMMQVTQVSQQTSQPSMVITTNQVFTSDDMQYGYYQFY